jgi:hypothetical protein
MCGLLGARTIMPSVPLSSRISRAMINRNLGRVSDGYDVRQGRASLLPRLPAGCHRAWRASDPRTLQSPGLSWPVPAQRSGERDRSHRCRVRDAQTARSATLGIPFLSNGSRRFAHRTYPSLASPMPRSDPLRDSTPISLDAEAWLVQLQRSPPNITPYCGDAITRGQDALPAPFSRRPPVTALRAVVATRPGRGLDRARD